jgi:hypothetical protein
MVLRFNEYGYLPFGDHEMTFTELKNSILVLGDESVPIWNESRRLILVQNLQFIVQQLWDIGIQNVFINGSFCTDKAHPEDIDCYFDVSLPLNTPKLEVSQIKQAVVMEALSQLFDELNTRVGKSIWDVWKKVYPDHYGNLKNEMWERYRIDIFPNIRGVYSGVLNADGCNIKFDELFRKDRNGVSKGIIKLMEG